MSIYQRLFRKNSPRDEPHRSLREKAMMVPRIEDNIRDSGQTYVFGRAESGENVTEKSAMQIATVYACVRLLAETIAGLPLHLYRYTDGGKISNELLNDSAFDLASYIATRFGVRMGNAEEKVRMMTMSMTKSRPRRIWIRGNRKEDRITCPHV